MIPKKRESISGISRQLRHAASCKNVAAKTATAIQLSALVAVRLDGHNGLVLYRVAKRRWHQHFVRQAKGGYFES